jgi:hypothetical protein
LGIESHQFFGQVSVTAGNGFDPGPSHAGPKKNIAGGTGGAGEGSVVAPAGKHLVERVADERTRRRRQHHVDQLEQPLARGDGGG